MVNWIMTLFSFSFSLCSFLTTSLWTEQSCTKSDVCFTPSISSWASQCFLGEKKKIPFYPWTRYLHPSRVGMVIFLSLWYRIGEKPGDSWDLPRVAVDALGAAMLVTIILDLWRLFLGPIVQIPETKQCLQPGLPWFPAETWSQYDIIT